MRNAYLIIALVLKDWRLFLADRRAALLSFAVPIILASAFGLIFNRPLHQTQPRLPLLVIDPGPSAGPLAAKVIQELKTGARTDIEVVTKDAALARVADRRPGVAVELPANLDSLSAFNVQNKPQLSIIHHALCAHEAHWAEGVVTEAILQTMAKNTFGVSAATPFTTAITPLETNAAFNSYSHSFSGMTLQYLLFWGMESGLLFLRDRSRGVWRRVRTAPVSLATIVLAKVLATAGIALAQLTVVFAFGWLAFGVTISGTIIGFVLLAVAVSVLAATTGLLVAAWGGTEARARAASILVILGVSMVGGLWLPSFLLPGWVRDVALCLPTTWAMKGLDAATWQNGGLLTVLPSVGVVAGFAFCFALVAAWRLYSQEARQRRGQLCVV